MLDSHTKDQLEKSAKKKSNLISCIAGGVCEALEPCGVSVTRAFQFRNLPIVPKQKQGVIKKKKKEEERGREIYIKILKHQASQFDQNTRAMKSRGSGGVSSFEKSVPSFKSLPPSLTA